MCGVVALHGRPWNSTIEGCLYRSELQTCPFPGDPYRPSHILASMRSNPDLNLLEHGLFSISRLPKYLWNSPMMTYPGFLLQIYLSRASKYRLCGPIICPRSTPTSTSPVPLEIEKGIASLSSEGERKVATLHVIWVSDMLFARWSRHAV